MKQIHGTKKVWFQEWDINYYFSIVSHWSNYPENSKCTMICILYNIMQFLLQMSSPAKQIQEVWTFWRSLLGSHLWWKYFWDIYTMTFQITIPIYSECTICTPIQILLLMSVLHKWLKLLWLLTKKKLLGLPKEWNGMLKAKHKKKRNMNSLLIQIIRLLC